MLLGLSRPDSGKATLLGEPARLAGSALRGVGVMIDGPAFVPHLSGLRNLHLLWTAAGRTWPPSALHAALELAGIGSALERKAKSYSMGMRQRLTRAQALMGAPRALVLDEPANGLDPGELRALREYLAELARQDVAILISSSSTPTDPRQRVGARKRSTRTQRIRNKFHFLKLSLTS
jgi:ABC-type multidrug transport system ATPase subunit